LTPLIKKALLLLAIYPHHPFFNNQSSVLERQCLYEDSKDAGT